MSDVLYGKFRLFLDDVAWKETPLIVSTPHVTVAGSDTTCNTTGGDTAAVTVTVRAGGSGGPAVFGMSVSAASYLGRFSFLTNSSTVTNSSGVASWSLYGISTGTDYATFSWYDGNGWENVYTSVQITVVT